MSRSGPRARTLFVAGILALATFGCATLKQMAALRRVDFSLAGARGSSLGGVSIDSVRSFSGLSALQVARLAALVARGELPLETDLQVVASNPADNAQARLVGMDWTLFLDDHETVSGSFSGDQTLPPGQPVTVPVHVRVDLMDAVGGQLGDLVDLALAVAGAGEPTRVRLEAIPSIETPLGPIRYPEPVRIERKVGGS
jgi:hypothetical protein